MDLKLLFDPYELRARIAPSIIVSLPLVICLYVGLKLFADFWISLLASGTILTVVTYGISFIVRSLGKSIEDNLWVQWSGAPSTRFLRWADKKFGNQLKEQMHQAVASVCGIQLMTRQQEVQDPDGADRVIADAFRQVRAVLQAKDKEGLWYKHNCEYGFVRNMLGSRVPFLLFSILGLIICGAFAYSTDEIAFYIAALLNLGFLSGSLILGWWLLPKMVKDYADRYAEIAWMSFVNLSKNRTH